MDAAKTERILRDIPDGLGLPPMLADSVERD